MVREGDVNFFTRSCDLRIRKWPEVLATFTILGDFTDLSISGSSSWVTLMVPK
jgi:hypothetical protein